MHTFSEHNPIAVAAYFLCVSGVAMFSMEPVLLLLSLAGAMALFLRMGGRGHGLALVLFVAAALVNPLVSHAGATVLFVVNDNPVTLEATLYGLAAAAMIVAVLYSFRTFQALMTSDRLLYLLGALSPRLALVISMAMRYVPLFTHQWRRTRQAQQALGLWREEDLLRRAASHLRVFSILLTWALENGVVTADSMAARGYGCTRRTHFAIFRFTWRDAALTAASLLLAGLSLMCAARRDFAFYPAISAAPADLPVFLGYAACALLALLPHIIDGKEALRWRSLRSRI